MKEPSGYRLSRWLFLSCKTIKCKKPLASFTVSQVQQLSRERESYECNISIITRGTPFKFGERGGGIIEIPVYTSEKWPRALEHLYFRCRASIYCLRHVLLTDLALRLYCAREKVCFSYRNDYIYVVSVAAAAVAVALLKLWLYWSFNWARENWTRGRVLKLCRKLEICPASCHLHTWWMALGQLCPILPIYEDDEGSF